ncbi:MAG: hypothetical protein CMI36_10625 [Owenweeksia sp.]|nr:hypothetical protein [Owenweeksia sp.]MBF99436.1 hypothetical protein [Owenweeksia sp.]
MSASQDRNNQIFQTTPLPDNYRSKVQREKALLEQNPNYTDPELEEFRQQEWQRRLYGYWFMLDGEPTYITGLHYFYLNYYEIDTTSGHPDYRDPDRLEFYFRCFVDHDPSSLGMLTVTRRRAGKTYKGGCWTLEGVSRTRKANGGIQSKTNTDSKKVFKKAIIQQFKKLADFFRPVYDTAQGLTPKSELSFFRPTTKGKKAEQDLDKEELESTIDFRASDEYAYDGYKLHYYLVDEVFKTTEADVYKRWEVHKFCLMEAKKVIGKAWFTSTVEEIEGKIELYKEIWNESDPAERLSDGRTRSGLYRYFIPAQDTWEFDKFGKCDSAKALIEINAIKDDLRSNQKKYSEFIHKNPTNIEEAFRIKADDCIYNSDKLQDQLDILSWGDPRFTRGNFEWKDNEKDTEVVFFPNKDGKWLLAWGFDDQEKDVNRVTKRGHSIIPGNRFLFSMGVDPFDHKKTQDGRFSNGAAMVYKRASSYDPEFSNTFVCAYLARPSNPHIFYEDMIKTAYFYGCEILFENNKPAMELYFDQRGYQEFLQWLPKRNAPGLPGSTQSHEDIAQFTAVYIEEHCDKVPFQRLIEDWLAFRIENTTKFDLAMAAGYALIADRVLVPAPTVSSKIKRSKLFKKHKIRLPQR